MRLDYRAADGKPDTHALGFSGDEWPKTASGSLDSPGPTSATEISISVFVAARAATTISRGVFPLSPRVRCARG